MKQFVKLSIILLIISPGHAAGQTDVNSIRFGSTGDPLHGLTIAWTNELGTADSIAWGNTPGLESGKYAGVKSSSIIGTQFDYTFPVQEAGSTIYYSILDSKAGVWTGQRTYLTASDATDDQFTFSVIGDSRSYPDMWKSIADAVWDTDFTLFMGDIIASGRNVTDWRKWFEYGDKFVSRELVYHCVGNHDADDTPSRIDNFLGLYTLPGNELYYSFTYGNAVFICLNTQWPSDLEQYNWLLSTLEANNDKTWKILFFHKPFYTSPSHSGEMDGYFNTWWKAFDDYGVDLIFNGHTHNYQRTRPINRNVSTTSPVENYGSGEGEGRCQIVAGSAGPLSGAADPSFWWLDNSASLRHFCIVDIDGDELVFKVMDASHVVLDSFAINKTTSEITFQVDLSEITDLYEGGAVNLVFGARDSSFIMTDPEGDGIYANKISMPIGTDMKYFFSYQTGANPETDYTDESVPPECSDAGGYRVLTAPHGNLTLPPVLFGSCDQAPQDIAFQVDLGKVSDLYDGGAAWLVFGDWDTSFVMTDPNADSIYTITVPVAIGTDLKYFFAYQNGADPEIDFVKESVPSECGDNEGYRLLRVPDSPLVLPPLLFGTCEVDKGPGPDILIPVINKNDDVEEYQQAKSDSEPAGFMDMSSSDLELCNETEGVQQMVGMIFRNVQIPPGSEITRAYIQFTADDDNSDAITVDIWGAKLATVPAPFTSAPFGVSSKPKTEALVKWTPEPWTPAMADAHARGPEQQTPDISSIIQEITGLDEWASGNNIMIAMMDPSGTAKKHREAESFEGATGHGDASLAATLAVYFKEGNVGITPVSSEFTSMIYPNPTEGKFYIENPSEDSFSYEIYTSNGLMIVSKNHISGSTAEVDMSGLSKGVYMVVVRSAERSAIHKLFYQ